MRLQTMNGSLCSLSGNIGNAQYVVAVGLNFFSLPTDKHYTRINIKDKWVVCSWMLSKFLTMLPKEAQPT